MAKAVIMAGGQGERFWPLTHRDFPKYCIRFEGRYSLLQRTYRRLRTVYPKDGIYVVTTRQHLGIIRRQLPGLFRKSRVLVEPSRNNTAAAILFSCARIGRECGEKEIVSFFPVDHLIRNEGLFRKTLRDVIAVARGNEYLVTVGVKPTFAATGYGYIESGRPIRGFAGAFRVDRFVEKPTRRRAVGYIRRKNFLWNGGMFTWRIGVFMATMKKVRPDIFGALDLKNLRGSYRRLPRLSIDKALFEKTDNMAVYRTRMDWCDIGSWDMLLEKSQHDKNGNYIEGLSCHRESSGSLLMNLTQLPLVTLGVSDILVVQTPRGTLVCRRGHSEEAALLAKAI